MQPRKKQNTFRKKYLKNFLECANIYRLTSEKKILKKVKKKIKKVLDF